MERIVMDWWTKIFLERLRQAEVQILMFKKYVDNINLCIAIIEKGWFGERERGKKPVFL